MRTAFIKSLFALAKDDPRIMLVVGDLGYGVVTPFMQELPLQFVNAGVAEQNMAGMAAGMSFCGKIVFTYSIANFPILRCLEQIRNDICYHNANVRIVSVGGGMAYGSLGVSHHATEDLAIMRALPNMLVLAPGDPVEVEQAVRALINYSGPAYLRLGKAGEPIVHSTKPDFQIGKALTLREGHDATLISTGGQLRNAVMAADLLQKDGIQVRVLSMHTLKPIDREAICAAAAETKAILTIEEHNISGGLGGAVAEILLESEYRPKHFKRIGMSGSFNYAVGDQAYLCHKYGLDPVDIARTVQEIL